jgi:hypothetical protein
LILDDWGLSILNPPERRDLLEILDDRHGRASTIVTSCARRRPQHRNDTGVLGIGSRGKSG